MHCNVINKFIFIIFRHKENTQRAELIKPLFYYGFMNIQVVKGITDVEKLSLIPMQR